MKWREAIETVLRDAPGPMGCDAITEEIATRKLRGDELGFTPAKTVSATITVSIRDEGNDSPFVKVAPGVYGLHEKVQREALADAVIPEVQAAEAEISSEGTGLVNAFGMFWYREKIAWAPQPKIWGQQQAGSSPVDFGDQRGVYLLHDAQGVVYVGRATDRGLGKRLFEHTNNRLSGRWDRFSWFGVHPVQEDGKLLIRSELPRLPVDVIIATMEAVLIEGLEPRQNRKRGDDFRAVEYVQAEDRTFELARIKAMHRKVEENFRP